MKESLKAFFRYTKAWKLNEYECLKLLSSPEQHTYESWLSGVVNENDVSEQLLDRLSQLLNIYKILSHRHSDKNQCLFLRNYTTDGFFQERSPLDFMMFDYEGLSFVRNYLEMGYGIENE